jgi:hypothetical protein
LCFQIDDYIYHTRCCMTTGASQLLRGAYFHFLTRAGTRRGITTSSQRTARGKALSRQRFESLDSRCSAPTRTSMVSFSAAAHHVSSTQAGPQSVSVVRPSVRDNWRPDETRMINCSGNDLQPSAARSTDSLFKGAYSAKTSA